VSAAKLKQLLNLLARGRALHWRNHVTIARRSFAKKAYPADAPPLADFVYRGAQFLFCADLLSERAYLEDAATAAFAQELFHALAGANGQRFHGLVDNYAQVMGDDDALARTFARDLCAAMTGGTSPGEVQALLAASRAIKKMSQLYTAQAFGDRALMKKLG
jgi:hypothetical protein